MCPSLVAAPALTVLAVPPARPLHATTRVHTQEEVGGGKEAAPAYIALQMRVPARGARCPRQQQPGQAQPEAAAHPRPVPAGARWPSCTVGGGVRAAAVQWVWGAGPPASAPRAQGALLFIPPVLVTPGMRTRGWRRRHKIETQERDRRGTEIEGRETRDGEMPGASEQRQRNQVTE